MIEQPYPPPFGPSATGSVSTESSYVRHLATVPTANAAPGASRSRARRSRLPSTLLRHWRGGGVHQVTFNLSELLVARRFVRVVVIVVVLVAQPRCSGSWSLTHRRAVWLSPIDSSGKLLSADLEPPRWEASGIGPREGVAAERHEEQLCVADGDGSAVGQRLPLFDRGFVQIRQVGAVPRRDRAQLSFPERSDEESPSCARGSRPRMTDAGAGARMDSTDGLREVT